MTQRVQSWKTNLRKYQGVDVGRRDLYGVPSWAASILPAWHLEEMLLPPGVGRLQPMWLPKELSFGEDPVPLISA